MHNIIYFIFSMLSSAILLLIPLSSPFHSSLLLTLFGVVEYLHLALLRAQQGLGQLRECTLHGAWSCQEMTCARLLHDLCPREAKHLAEALVAVDDATVFHLCVSNQELAA